MGEGGIERNVSEICQSAMLVFWLHPFACFDSLCFGMATERLKENVEGVSVFCTPNFVAFTVFTHN